jgi:Domain of unknown function (DUF4198)
MGIERPARRSVPALIGTLVALCLTDVSLRAHDLFFRPRAWLLTPAVEASVNVLSGTFSVSENAITRDRLADLSLAGPVGRVSIESANWSETEPQSAVRFTPAASGTYVLGAAIRPRLLSLPGAEFNAYLREEGLDRVLERRRAQGRTAEASRERYSKYVKAILQAGDTATSGWSTVLGYAAEIVPDANPYELHAGSSLTVRCLVDGQPLVGHAVYAGGRFGTGDRRLPQQRLMTDAEGRVTIRLTSAGSWYVKFVSMREIDDPDANYESKWSTLSFAVGALGGTTAPAPRRTPASP